MTIYHVLQESEPSPVARMVNRMISARYPGEAGLEIIMRVADIGTAYAYGTTPDEYRADVVGNMTEKQLNTLIEFLLEDNPI